MKMGAAARALIAKERTGKAPAGIRGSRRGLQAWASASQAAESLQRRSCSAPSKTPKPPT